MNRKEWKMSRRMIDKRERGRIKDGKKYRIREEEMKRADKIKKKKRKREKEKRERRLGRRETEKVRK